MFLFYVIYSVHDIGVQIPENFYDKFEITVGEVMFKFQLELTLHLACLKQDCNQSRFLVSGLKSRSIQKILNGILNYIYLSYIL